MIENKESKLVIELRKLTGCNLLECKEALKSSGWDLKKAEEKLRRKSYS